jgi:cytoskeleton protein RodZ
MTKGSFGDNLKREREMRGVSLDEISAATRIATRFLQAIESEQWDQLPGGVFNRGFVRAVAHYLGLDEENIVAEYVLAAGDQQSVPVWTGRPPVVTAERPWLGWIVVAAVIIALLAGGWFGVRQIYARRAARRAERNPVVSAVPLPVAPEMPAVTLDSTQANTMAAPPPPSSAPGSAADSAAGSALGTNAMPPPTSLPTPLVTTPDPNSFELKVEAGKKTKVTVQADASRVFQGTMKAGENRTFTAKDRFDISARDAGALQLELNGKALAPIGSPGHSGKATLTREALKAAPGGAN